MKNPFYISTFFILIGFGFGLFYANSINPLDVFEWVISVFVALVLIFSAVVVSQQEDEINEQFTPEQRARYLLD